MTKTCNASPASAQIAVRLAPMSGWGQFRKSGHVTGISVIASGADIVGLSVHVCEKARSRHNSITSSARPSSNFGTVSLTRSLEVDD